MTAPTKLPPPVVYMVQADDGPVKIGTSRSVDQTDKRLRDIQMYNHHELTLIRAIEGSYTTETWLHQYFASYNILIRGKPGEWFHFHPEMLTIKIPPDVRLEDKRMQAENAKYKADPEAWHTEQTKEQAFEKEQRELKNIIEELHGHVHAIWLRSGKQGASDMDLHKFLMARVTSEKIAKIIYTAERGGLIIKLPGTDKWFPRPRVITKL